MSGYMQYKELTPLEKLTVFSNLSETAAPIFETYIDTLGPYHVVTIDELFLLTEVLNIIYESGHRISRIEKERNATDIDIAGDEEFKLRIRKGRLSISRYNVFMPAKKYELKRMLNGKKAG